MITTTGDTQRELARRLHDAERACFEIDPLTTTHPGLTLDDAYAIQRELVRLAGGRIVGVKAALTSAAKQQAMNVTQPGFGVLLDWMRVDGTLDRSGLIHPRVEPEIALFFEGFHQTRHLTALDVAKLATGFAPAFEVIDSRYRNFRFTASDVYADNCSSARFTVSSNITHGRHPDLELAGVIFEKNGSVVHTGTPAAVLGSPYASAAFILNLAFDLRVELPGCFVLLTGGITDAVPAEPGDTFRAVFGAGIGDVTLRVV